MHHFRLWLWIILAWGAQIFDHSAVDRFSNWPDVRETPSGTDRYGSKGLIRACRELFATFGVPVEISTDGGPHYKAGDLADFFRTWGVSHRMSSAFFAQSNGRAEVGVKSVKRMLRGTTWVQMARWIQMR